MLVQCHELILTPEEETMKRRLLLALVGLVMGVACQQTKTPLGPLEFSVQIVALGKKIDDAFNNGDAAASCL
jgi:hypothetical protein